MKRIFLIFLYRLLIRPFLRLIVGIRFDQKDKFLKYPQYIIVANHNSHIDTAVILASLPNERLSQTHPTAAGDYFSHPLLRAIVSLFFNAVYISRQSVKGLDDMQAVLACGESLIIYPEGTRGKPEVLSRFKKGVGVLLQRNPHIPFIPIYLKGMGKIMPKNDGLIVPFSARQIVGEPQFIESDQLDKIMEQLIQAMTVLERQDGV